ncbi:cellulose biosynthesis cyclic di-GMP-binding regulatory protein BcsB [Belliella marina]|uniref:Cellulose biosynthesis cyclic di-GMP-binding regulatory protein BcsB n=1 Tax=Belliella marina TaxID=1644146 RepID=A0ABW4VKV4_9BACT
MKKLYRFSILKCIALILGLFIGNLSFAGDQFFSEFGYPNNTMIYGPKSSTAFFFKQRNDLEHSGSFVHLEVVSSQVLDTDLSSIVFVLNDTPVLTTKILGLGDTLKIDLPVKTADFATGYLKLEVRSNLFKKDEDCRDYGDPDYWVKVTSDSFLSTELVNQFATIKASKTLDKFIPQIERLVIPRNNDLKLAQLASYVHFYYRSSLGQNLPISYLDEIPVDSLDYALIIGTWDLIGKSIDDNLPVKAGQGELKILQKEVINSQTGKLYFTSNIVLTGGDFEGMDKAIRLLFEKDLSKSAVTDHLKIYKSSTSASEFTYHIKNEYSLNELGLKEEMTSGTCRIIKNVEIPRFLSKSELKLLSLKLRVNHMPITAANQGYINVYLNNSLLQTFSLDESGVVDMKIDIKRKPIYASSYFTMEFINIPVGGCCNSHETGFFAQIDPFESKINLDIDGKAPMIFSAFPENFAGKPIQLLTDLQITKEEIPALSNLISQINLQTDFLDNVYLPEMNILQENLFDNSNNHVVIITNQPHKYNNLFQANQYVRFYGDSISYQSDELETFFTVNYNKGLTYAQLFSNLDQKVLMISHLSDNSESLNKIIDGMYDQFLTNSGNVLLANDQRYYFFDLRDKVSGSQKLEKKKSFESFWDSYKLFIIIILLAFIIVLLSYIFRKSELAKTQIEDARK